MQMIKQKIRTCEFKGKYSDSFQENRMVPHTKLRLGHRYWQISNRVFYYLPHFCGKCFQTKPEIKEEQRNQTDYYKRQQEIK